MAGPSFITMPSLYLIPVECSEGAEDSQYRTYMVRLFTVPVSMERYLFALSVAGCSVRRYTVQSSVDLQDIVMPCNPCPMCHCVIQYTHTDKHTHTYMYTYPLASSFLKHPRQRS